MSAVLQVRVRESEAISTADPAVGRDNPLQLLREAISRLNSSSGELPDQTQMADLLAEVREALERANVIARAAAQCEEFLGDAQFDKALQSLDAALLVYPGDPALIARRNDVEERQRAFQSAATVRTALEEAQWLLNQDRLDLAARFLKEKAVALPDQPALIFRLEEIEARLPQWEQDRQVQAALGRVAALEELEQWQVALTTVEEALRSYSASEELTGAAKRVRDRLAEHERQNRLTRRLELIRQKIASQSWRQALTLLEKTQREFPGAPELNPLRREADTGLRRSECEAVVTEVRQCLTDGDPEQAEQVLRRGLEAFGQEPALEALREELEFEKKCREELRAAQILFGRRQLVEAERVLEGLVARDRTEAQALLDAVRQARAVTEEENFFEGGREKALRLIEQRQFAQAADLLRNLHSLFPGNPILERDLMAAQGALDRERPAVTPATEAEDSELQAPQPKAPMSEVGAGTARVSPPLRVWLVIAGAAVLALVSVGGAAWKLSRNAATVSRPIAAPVATQMPAATPLPVTQEASSPKAVRPIEMPPKASPQPAVPPPLAHPPLASASAALGNANVPPETSPARAVRPFVPPATKQAPVQVQGSIPLPPDAEAIVSAQMVASLPAALTGRINAPAPLPELPPQSVAPRPSVASAPAPKPAPPGANGYREAELITRTMPAYPALARRLGIFGAVLMEAALDERGTVKSVKAVSGNQILTTAAEQAIVRWKYKAATLNGKPTASTVTIQVVFADPGK